jgi:hypothetical protein
MKTDLKAYASTIGELVAEFSKWETQFEWQRFASGPATEYGVTEKEHSSIKKLCRIAIEISTEFNLNITKQKAVALSDVLDTKLPVTSHTDATHRMREVRETMLQELRSIMFLQASEDMKNYLNLEHPFGSSVNLAFPNCADDISEAHNCLSLGRYTASMFHLGRAMEIAVKAVAKKMGIKNKRDDWQSYLSAMNDAVNAMPFKTPKDKAKRLPFAETTGHFFNFKEAWRNPTFHAKKTYTREEALAVLHNAGVFMDSVARLIIKVKVTQGYRSKRVSSEKTRMAPPDVLEDPANHTPL